MQCAYEFQRFEKVAWSYVKKGAKLVFEVGIIFSCYLLLLHPRSVQSITKEIIVNNRTNNNNEKVLSTIT